MRDKAVKGLLLRDLENRSIYGPCALPILFATYLAGVVSTVALIAILNGEVTEDNLAKLATIASYSTGAPPTAHWNDAVVHTTKWWRRLLPADTINRLLVEVDTNVCSIRNTANAKRDYWEIRTTRPGNSNH